jgi:hypothetical protein
VNRILEQLANLFGASRYLAHSICLTNDPVIIPLFLISDAGIGFAYYIIAGILYYSYSNKARVIKLVLIILNDRSFLKLFFLFILCCGLTHHSMLLTFWYGVYYLDAFTRFVTFVISAGTAIRVVLVIWQNSKTSSNLDKISGKTADYSDIPLTVENKTLKKSEPTLKSD